MLNCVSVDICGFSWSFWTMSSCRALDSSAWHMSGSASLAMAMFGKKERVGWQKWGFDFLCDVPASGESLPCFCSLCRASHSSWQCPGLGWVNAWACHLWYATRMNVLATTNWRIHMGKVQYMLCLLNWSIIHLKVYLLLCSFQPCLIRVSILNVPPLLQSCFWNLYCYRNMELICALPGGQDCQNFFMITAQVEATAVPGVKVSLKPWLPPENLVILSWITD